MNPFFSIVIPSYNRKEFLNIALKSIADQAFTDYEIIVVNDGSSDGTQEFLESEMPSNIKLIAILQENTERGKARNNGWKAAKGQYVVFFDSDDIMLSNYLTVLHANIKAHNPDLVACKFAFRRKDKTFIHRDQVSLKGEYDFELFLNGNPIACHFSIKNNPEQFDLFNEDRSLSSMEDWLFLLSNTVRHKILLIDEICVHMQIHDQQSVGNDKLVIERKLRTEKIILEKIQLTREQKKQLRAHVLENVAIHQINLKQNFEGIKNLIRSLSLNGIKPKHLYNIARAMNPF